MRLLTEIHARSRVRRNLRRWHGLEGNDRLAGQYLLSMLAHLETIAVIAAERGDGIRGQLLDELAHRATFEAIAEDLGGLLEPSREVSALIDYLVKLEGDDSIAALNIVGEAWLENVFHHIGPWVAPELFELLEAEEARHAREAAAAWASPWRRPGSKPVQVVAELEGLLWAIARSPGFLIPVTWFGGERGAAWLGLEAIDRHRKALEPLGLEPGEQVAALRADCLAALVAAGRAPEPAHMDAWRRSATAACWPNGPAPMVTFEDVWVRSAEAGYVEAAVLCALGRILARTPRSKRTIRRGRLWKPAEVVIGVRRLHDRLGNLVCTAYVTSPQAMTIETAQGAIARRMKRLRRDPYTEVPELGDLVELLPPSRCAATISYNGDHGVKAGLAPLVEHEGTPISIVIGYPRPERVRFGYDVTLGIQYDHRAGDGREIGHLARELKRELS